MKLNNIDEMNRFNDLLNSCQGAVILQCPDGRFLTLTDKTFRLQGLFILSGDDADSCGLYAQLREDEALLMDYLCRRLKTA